MTCTSMARRAVHNWITSFCSDFYNVIDQAQKFWMTLYRGSTVKHVFTISFSNNRQGSGRNACWQRPSAMASDQGQQQQQQPHESYKKKIQGAILSAWLEAVLEIAQWKPLLADTLHSRISERNPGWPTVFYKTRPRFLWNWKHHHHPQPCLEQGCKEAPSSLLIKNQLILLRCCLYFVFVIFLRLSVSFLFLFFFCLCWNCRDNARFLLFWRDIYVGLHDTGSDSALPSDHIKFVIPQDFCGITWHWWVIPHKCWGITQHRQNLLLLGIPVH